MRSVRSQREDFSVREMIDLSQGELALLLVRSFTSGILLGLTYDLLRAFKMLLGVEYVGGNGNSKKNKAEKGLLFAVTFLTDLLFFTGAGCVAIFLAYADGGFFRGMILLGMAIGFLLYYFTLGKIVLSVNAKIISLLKKTVRKLIPYLIKPLKTVCGRIIFLYHLTIGSIIDKIKSDIKNKDHEDKSACRERSDDGAAECGKEDFVYVNGKVGYRKEGRVSFGPRGR